MDITHLNTVHITLHYTYSPRHDSHWLLTLLLTPHTLMPEQRLHEHTTVDSLWPELASLDAGACVRVCVCVCVCACECAKEREREFV